MNKPVAMIALLAGAAAVTGCSGVRNALGVEKAAPDEFRVVTTAPLTIPPDYNLRPPKPGEGRPQELQPDVQAQVALFGQQVGVQASEGERILVKKAGAEAVDPKIRELVDQEGADIVRKPEGFADRVLGFARLGSDEKKAQAPIDAEAEAARLKAEKDKIEKATGGKPVTIQKNEPGRIKLPGL